MNDIRQLSNEPELIIGISCAVGTNSSLAVEIISKTLCKFNYKSICIKLSKLILEPLIDKQILTDPVKRANHLMDAGNDLRYRTKDNSIMALASAFEILKVRNEKSISLKNEADNLMALKQLPNTAFIIDSLKHPEEVRKLREIYPIGFWLFAFNEPEDDRVNNLGVKNIGKIDAEALIKRDSAEAENYGQHTRDVFELADFHVSFCGWKDHIKDIKNNTHPQNEEEYSNMAKKFVLEKQIVRMFKLIFGSPYTTPTFDEYAMFMAYSSGLRSADLSRQIGAVIATDKNEIISTGANDVPKYLGGQYWPDFDANYTYKDKEGGRDYTLGYDPNKMEHERIAEEIVDLFNFNEEVPETENRESVKRAILESSIKYLTEYGRVVHAEMAAIIACARTGISLHEATLYCCTYPCHNCAKHIVAAGIKRVVYIEPYPKSKALELHNDSISLTGEEGKVIFEAFKGVGPRRFFDLFSLRLSSGYDIIRKDNDNKVVEWDFHKATIRNKMFPVSYIERETYEASKFNSLLEKSKGEQKMSSPCVDAKSISENTDYNYMLLHALSTWPKWKLVSLSMEKSDKELQELINTIVIDVRHSTDDDK